MDDFRVPLPRGLGGVMVLNLPSYAGGVNLWSTEDADDLVCVLNKLFFLRVLISLNHKILMII